MTPKLELRKEKAGCLFQLKEKSIGDKVDMSNHNFETDYYEFLAKRILENALPDEYHDIIVQDRPDLVNHDGRGIEVTRALYSGTAEASKMFQIIKNKRMDEASQRAVKRLEELGYRIVIRSDGVIAGCGPNEALWVTTGKLETCYLSKLQKIDDYGIATDLFIYAPVFDLYDKEDIVEFQDWMLNYSKHSQRLFLRVFVFEHNNFYVCDNVSRTVSMIRLETSIIDNICKEALEHAKSKG